MIDLLYFFKDRSVLVTEVKLIVGDNLLKLQYLLSNGSRL